MEAGYMAGKSVWQGQLVRLRAVEPEDWQQFFEWDQDTESLRYNDRVGFPGSREQARKWTEEQATAQARNDEFRWVIETPAGEFVGAIDTHTCDTRVGTFRYGVAIRREHWRKGYATEAIRLVLTYFFHELRYQKVNVEVYEYNTASLELHRKLGFREEGRLRRTVYTGGQYYDELRFGMTREEFEESLE